VAWDQEIANVKYVEDLRRSGVELSLRTPDPAWLA
jgi:hypothetical protein